MNTCNPYSYNLEEYFIASALKGVVDHAVRANVNSEGKVSFYIHPASTSGYTCDYEVSENSLKTLYVDED